MTFRQLREYLSSEGGSAYLDQQITIEVDREHDPLKLIDAGLGSIYFQLDDDSELDDFWK